LSKSIALRIEARSFSHSAFCRARSLSASERNQRLGVAQFAKV
jgi:hypothetical protein